MISQNGSALPPEAQLRAAQAVVERLQRRVQAGKPFTKTKRKKPVRNAGRTSEGQVPLAPGYHASCFVGSLYATILTVLARVGNLCDHERLFNAFKRARTPEAAHQLLDHIGVRRTDLETMVRADARFREHCDRRTRRLRNRAATGNSRAKRILSNRAICDSRRRWIGDIDEAVSILKGERAPNQRGVHKNTRILRKLKLVFNTTLRNGAKMCHLFPAKFYSLFQAARAQAGE